MLIAVSSTECMPMNGSRNTPFLHHSRCFVGSLFPFAIFLSSPSNPSRRVSPYNDDNGMYDDRVYAKACVSV